MLYLINWKFIKLNPAKKKINNHINPFIKKKVKLPITRYLPILLLIKRFNNFFSIYQ